VLDCDDDISGLTFRSLASVTLAADQSVIVVLDGYSGNSVGMMELYIDALPVSQPGGSCCDGDSGVGGCGTPDVEACVCSFRPECCDGEWDAQCVSGAASECLAVCGCIEFAGCDAPSDDCVCQGCNVDGVCDENDDCIDCIDCIGEPACGCNPDGLCEPFNESCDCPDCADEVVCTG
jgi:hypothetical protein